MPFIEELSVTVIYKKLYLYTLADQWNNFKNHSGMAHLLEVSCSSASSDTRISIYRDVPC
jgi:hypothetical protein